MTDAPVIAAKDIDGLPRYMLTRGVVAVTGGKKKLTAPGPVARSGILAGGV